MIKVLAKAIVVIILQYINVSNQHMEHLKLHNIICQLHLNLKTKKRKDIEYGHWQNPPPNKGRIYTYSFQVQVYLRDITNSVPDHCIKVNTAIKQVTQTFWFPDV